MDYILRTYLISEFCTNSNNDSFCRLINYHLKINNLYQRDQTGNIRYPISHLMCWRYIETDEFKKERSFLNKLKQGDRLYIACLTDLAIDTIEALNQAEKLRKQKVLIYITNFDFKRSYNDYCGLVHSYYSYPPKTKPKTPRRFSDAFIDEVINCISGDEPVSLTQLSKLLGINRNTLQRYVPQHLKYTRPRNGFRGLTKDELAKLKSLLPPSDIEV